MVTSLPSLMLIYLRNRTGAAAFGSLDHAN